MATALAAALTDIATANDKKTGPRILLRSSWQVVNIGDIAHTPGVLALIEKHIPNAEVRLWASGDLSQEVAAMEHRRFPKLKIVKGTISANGNASNSELDDALNWCDFLLHGSGPSLVAERDVSAFDRHIGKPFGVYGITYAGGQPAQIDLLSRSKFVFFRDTVSLDKAKKDGVTCPIMEFGPDGAFACDLRDDPTAEKWLAEKGLQTEGFVCCIPRLRYTPYWLIRPNTTRDDRKDLRNMEMAESDFAPLRKAIEAIVAQTDLKVLLCPEDRTQMAVGKRWILDSLAEKTQQRVVWREGFWLTDEALSTYARSAGLFGLEMHSPIMCIGNGIPAIVGRFAEQTSKGFMWRDIGLGDWLFDFDLSDDKIRYPHAVVEMVTQRRRSSELVKKAQAIVKKHQSATMTTLQKSLFA